MVRIFADFSQLHIKVKRIFLHLISCKDIMYHLKVRGLLLNTFSLSKNLLPEESVLLDLKHLLIEARQNVPPFLASMQADTETYLEIGGQYYPLMLWCCCWEAKVKNME